MSYRTTLAHKLRSRFRVDRRVAVTRNRKRISARPVMLLVALGAIRACPVRFMTTQAVIDARQKHIPAALRFLRIDVTFDASHRSMCTVIEAGVREPNRRHRGRPDAEFRGAAGRRTRIEICRPGGPLARPYRPGGAGPARPSGRPGEKAALAGIRGIRLLCLSSRSTDGSFRYRAIGRVPGLLPWADWYYAMPRLFDVPGLDRNIDDLARAMSKPLPPRKEVMDGARRAAWQLHGWLQRDPPRFNLAARLPEPRPLRTSFQRSLTVAALISTTKVSHSLLTACR